MNDDTARDTHLEFDRKNHSAFLKKFLIKKEKKKAFFMTEKGGQGGLDPRPQFQMCHTDDYKHWATSYNKEGVQYETMRDRLDTKANKPEYLAFKCIGVEKGLDLFDIKFYLGRTIINRKEKK